VSFWRVLGRHFFVFWVSTKWQYYQVIQGLSTRELASPPPDSGEQGDLIRQIFNIWLLFTWVFLNFYLNMQFQNTVCCTYFNIEKQFDVTIFHFQFELS
jgi:hypothetical protein